jgi:uncharacterized protein YjbJ (UPF0337 family)
MDWHQVAGEWQHFREKVRDQWHYLTDEDLDYIDGSYDRLTERLCDKCGLKEEGAAKQAVDDWLSAMGHARMRDPGGTGG